MVSSKCLVFGPLCCCTWPLRRPGAPAPRSGRPRDLQKERQSKIKCLYRKPNVNLRNAFCTVGIPAFHVRCVRKKRSFTARCVVTPPRAPRVNEPSRMAEGSVVASKTCNQNTSRCHTLTRAGVFRLGFGQSGTKSGACNKNAHLSHALSPSRPRSPYTQC